MFISERHEPLLPFPRLPETVKAGYSLSALALRPFGLYESDLNVDFSHPLRPFLVTDILKCCTRSTQTENCEQSFFWNLPIGKRIECLLTLLLSETGSEIPVTFRCPNQECAQELEVEISVEEITALQAQAYETERVVVSLENGSFALRRPTGKDQLAWLKSRFADQESANHAMLRTLLLEDAGAPAIDGGAIPSEMFPVVERAMDEFDPLVNFSLLVKCFSCEMENLFAIDLEELSLRKLRRAQLRLLASVHNLAAHYHWSEQQVFSVPYWRRAHYLSLIKKEKNQ